MKLEKFIYNPSKTPVQNAIDTVTMHLLAYGKVYELLHKQLWRKAPYRIWSYNIPQIPTFNNRPVTFVRGWNIKSPSTVPYNYEGGDYTFGLNQLFMDQDYRKPYVGNPKDGIYHDDCYIEPKHIPATNEGYYDCWGYYTDSYFDWEGVGTVYEMGQTWEKQNSVGDVVISGVSLQTYSVTVPPTPPATVGVTTHYKKIVVTYANGSTSIVELGSYDPLTPQTDGITSGQSNNPYSYFGYKKWKKNFDEFSVHGNIVSEVQTSAIFSLTNLAMEYGWIRVYQDGTVIEYAPESYEAGDPGYYTPAHYKILPMMYTDTGDLAMDRVEFVEKWNDYFELYVHEDSEWWEAFIKPIAAIITIVIAVYTGIIYNPIGAIGTALSVVGTLGGNQQLSLIGGIMMAGAGIYNSIEEIAAQNILSNAPPSMSIGAARDIAQNMGYQELYGQFISGAGLSNWLNVGSKVFSIGSNIDAFSSFQNISGDTSLIPESTNSHNALIFVRGEDDPYDPERIIRL